MTLRTMTIPFKRRELAWKMCCLIVQGGSTTFQLYWFYHIGLQFPANDLKPRITQILAGELSVWKPYTVRDGSNLMLWQKVVAPYPHGGERPSKGQNTFVNLKPNEKTHVYWDIHPLFETWFANTFACVRPCIFSHEAWEIFLECIPS